MNRLGAITQQLRIWGLILGLWALLVLAFAGQLVFTNSIPWTDAMRLSLRDWYPWALLGPLSAWLAFRFPLERDKLVISLPVHIVACMLAVLCCQLLLGQPQPRGQFGASPLRPRLENPPPGAEGEDHPPEGGMPERRPGFVPGGRRPMFFDALAAHAKFNLPIYWVIVSIVHALTYYRRSQERELQALELEARLTDAKLQALRAQLHPHFLFNTLNAISTLVHRDPNAADEMIVNLSELLRATLDTTEREIPLSRELELLDRYLEIQQTRFGSRLQISRQIDPGVLSQLVPPLILQPLAENAIRHGIEPKTTPGLLTITANRREGILRLTLQDNGEGKAPAGNQPSHGIGLSNTRARLLELYGAQARLLAGKAPEGGFAVEVELPCHEHPL
jgi:hypothetical protein